MQQSRHFRVKRRLASGKGSVEIKHNELFQYASTMTNSCDLNRGPGIEFPPLRSSSCLRVVNYSGSAISNRLTAPRGQRGEGPITAGRNRTSPFRIA